MKEDIDDLFKKGIELRDSGKFSDATDVFLTVIQNSPSDSKLAGTYSVLAGIYFDLNDFEHSLIYFMKATQLNPKSELASLGLYLSYIELDKHEMAINEIQRYLDQYPADLYKDTLEELLIDLKSGYATNYEETILKLAKRNDIKID